MSKELVIAITDKAKLERRVHELKRRDEGVKARMAPVLKQLWNPERKLAIGASDEVFDDLNLRFPNFGEVIEYWRLQASISRRLGTHFQSAPVLLGGEAGVGKTYFAYESAKALGLHYSEINMATVTANFVLSGGSLQWGEGSIGFIANSLSESKIGNPMILLDEIDKASTGNKYDPLGPFYPLLEKHSASRFKDEALDLELDSSFINWIMTANNLQKIPAPILSRAKVFNIELPATDQMPAIVKSIYKGIRLSEPFGKELDENLPNEVLYMFDGESPRVVKRMLTEACSKAFLDNRTLIHASDFEITKPHQEKIYKLGFI